MVLKGCLPPVRGLDKEAAFLGTKKVGISADFLELSYGMVSYGLSGTRTLDLMIKSHLLYQLS
jgi:hypothetical protein